MFTQATIWGIALLAFSFVSGIPEGVPTCAIHCYDKDVDSCARSDVYCRCTNKELIATITECLWSACPLDQLKDTKSIAEAWCASHGAELVVPSYIPTPTSPSSATPTATATPSATPSPSSGTTPAQSDEEPATQNANGAIPLKVNIVAGVIAFGLVVFAM